MKIGILHGPNLNYLGKRKPEIYGNINEKKIVETVRIYFPETEIAFFQSSHEGALIDQLYDWNKDLDGIIFNAGALTHYSYSLRDTIESIETPVVEVHITQIAAREEFRKSVLAPVCIGSISGFGLASYLLGMAAFNWSKEV
ncbi:MAG: 3-dehydroquinate dehydratase [Calditrichia bacterium]|nr:3-dehydroquinate dehydratase [Calditrichia bacterium]